MLDIVAVLSVKSSYDTYRQAVPKHVLSKEANMIVDDMGEYFNLFPNIEVVDWSEFESWFTYLKHSAFKEDKLAMFREIFSNLRAFECSEVTEEIVRSFIERDFAARAADLCLKIQEGTVTDKLQDVVEFVDDYVHAAQIIEEQTFVEDDILDMCKESEGGLDWRLDCLNESLGPLRKGNLVVFGKLPESGGTAMAVSECANFLTQLPDNASILYLSNEERGQAIRERVVSAVINKPWKAFVLKHPVACRDEFKKRGGDRIKICSVHGKTMPQIETIIKHTQPSVIVFDQLWKVSDHSKNSNEVTKITNLFYKARVVAAEYAPVIVIHQADGSAYSSKYAEMNQLYMSRIGVQGESDAIITIGIDPENRDSKTRYINVCKNKLEGGPKSDESMRHSKHECQLLAEVSRFKG